MNRNQLSEKLLRPKALFWFRWAALGTIVTGLVVSYLQGYVHQAMILGIGSGDPKTTAIGIGMWLGIIMAYNVWFVIWPNQKKALGIVDCSPDEKLNQLKLQCCFREQILSVFSNVAFNGSSSKPLLIMVKFFLPSFSKVL